MEGFCYFVIFFLAHCKLSLQQKSPQVFCVIGLKHFVGCTCTGQWLFHIIGLLQLRLHLSTSQTQGRLSNLDSAKNYFSNIAKSFLHKSMFCLVSSWWWLETKHILKFNQRFTHYFSQFEEGLVRQWIIILHFVIFVRQRLFRPRHCTLKSEKICEKKILGTKLPKSSWEKILDLEGCI